MIPPNNKNQSETLASPAHHKEVMPLFMKVSLDEKGWRYADGKHPCFLGLLKQTVMLPLPEHISITEGSSEGREGGVS